MPIFQSGESVQNFPNGSVVVTAYFADNATTPPTPQPNLTTITITKAADGSLPPGYPAAFPGAVVQ